MLATTTQNNNQDRSATGDSPVVEYCRNKQWANRQESDNCPPTSPNKHNRTTADPMLICNSPEFVSKCDQITAKKVTST